MAARTWHPTTLPPHYFILKEVVPLDRASRTPFDPFKTFLPVGYEGDHQQTSYLSPPPHSPSKVPVPLLRWSRPQAFNFSLLRLNRSEAGPGLDSVSRRGRSGPCAAKPSTGSESAPSPSQRRRPGPIGKHRPSPESESMALPDRDYWHQRTVTLPGTGLGGGSLVRSP
eukprot:756299-Hanusia_phi.AAC.1